MADSGVDGPARKTEEAARSTVARYDIDLRKREQSPGRLVVTFKIDLQKPSLCSIRLLF